MTLKELYERNYPQEMYSVVGDYLYKPAEFRAKYSFEDYLEEVDICPVCGELCERDDMVFHKCDWGEVGELICPSCRNDEDI